MKSQKLSYKNSGVNINAADNFVKYISNLNKKRNFTSNSNNIGNFGSINKIPSKLEEVFFCGCKHSKKGAFCDGTHKEL